MEGGQEVAAACREAGSEATVVQGDVADDAACHRLVTEATSHFGRLDILVNNAATTRATPLEDLDGLDGDELHRVFDVNVVGVYQMTRAAAAALRASGDGAVVNVSSTAGIHGRGSSIAYAASKGALNTMTRSFAHVLAPQVRVNAVLPGGILGNWTRKILTEEQYEARVRASRERYPLQRAPWPDDVAEVIAWLVEHGNTMTGEYVRMDSGQHLP
jgi:3-oxoacyl-[acyl-carrier protein] reductase